MSTTFGGYLEIGCRSDFINVLDLTQDLDRLVKAWRWTWRTGQGIDRAQVIYHELLNVPAPPATELIDLRFLNSPFAGTFIQITSLKALIVANVSLVGAILLVKAAGEQGMVPPMVANGQGLRVAGRLALPASEGYLVDGEHACLELAWEDQGATGQAQVIAIGEGELIADE